jgi:hypothetical protein
VGIKSKSRIKSKRGWELNRYSGYGEALSGSARAQAGLLSVIGQAEWGRGAAEYRMRLYVEGDKAGESGKADAPLRRK